MLRNIVRVVLGLLIVASIAFPLRNAAAYPPEICDPIWEECHDNCYNFFTDCVDNCKPWPVCIIDCEVIWGWCKIGCDVDNAACLLMED